MGYFGRGAGAGSGEPAGIFVSIGPAEDFAAENTKRNLGLDVVLPLRLHVKSVLQWDRDERLAYTMAARLEFLQTRFHLSIEEATAIIRYTVRILRTRTDLDAIADWLSTRDGEREMAVFLNKKLQADGYDAVAYRDPWHGVQQMIVLDANKIEILDK